MLDRVFGRFLKKSLKGSVPVTEEESKKEHLRKLKEIREKTGIGFQYFCGWVVPEDVRFCEYLAFALRPYSIPNEGEGEIKLSLSLLSRIWREREGMRCEVSMDLDEETVERIAKFVEVAGERLKEFRLSDDPEEILKKLEEVQNDELEGVEEEVPSVAGEVEIGKLYGCRDLEEFTEVYAAVRKEINPEKLKHILRHPELVDLLEKVEGELREVILDPVLSNALCFSLLVLDVFGDSTPSVVRKEREERTFYSAFVVPGTGTKVSDEIERFSLLAHTVSMALYALRDLKMKVERSAVTRSEAAETFISVLIHDIGKVQTSRAKGKTKEHFVLSAELAEKFLSLPEGVVDAVRHHHRTSIEEGSYEDLPKVTRMLIEYDRTERQMEISALYPAAGEVVAPPGKFTQKDLSYLRAWLSKRVREERKEEGIDAEKVREILRGIKEEAAEEFKFEDEWVVLPYQKFASKVKRLRSLLGGEKAKSLVQIKKGNIYIRRDLFERAGISL